MMDRLQGAFVVLGFVQQDDGFFKERPLDSVDLKGQVFRRDILIRIGHCSAVNTKSALNDKSRAFVTGSEPL